MTDDLGRALTLRLPARRILSLSPATTENLFAVGAERQLVGVTTACDFPPAAARLPRVGDFQKPSYERIAALKPDLIVVESATITRADADALAARTRVAVFVQRSLTVADVARHLIELDALCGTTRGKKLAQTLPKATTARPGLSAPTVFIEVSASPLYAVGPGSFVDDAIRVVGGRNALTEGGQFPLVTREKLLALNPRFYVIATTPGVVHPGFPAPLDRLRAVREGRVLSIPADLLFRPTPRLAEGIRLLRRALVGS